MTTPQLDVIVRTERSSDVPFVRAVEEAAFGRAVEADIVDAVRVTDDWLKTGSIVAVDGMRRVVGHVLLCRGRLLSLDGAERHDIGTIGPVAVLPELQRRGVGKALMRAAISAAVAARFVVVCLVGHPTYYPRFGFERARAIGLEPPGDWPDDAWLALRLPGWSAAVRGVVQFPPVFPT